MYTGNYINCFFQNQQVPASLSKRILASPWELLDVDGCMEWTYGTFIFARLYKYKCS